MLDFIDILEAKQSGDMNKLNEASLSRVYRHVSGDKSFAILTAWRAGNSLKQNISNQKELEDIIRKNNLGFFKLKGHWQECPDPNMPYEECPKEELIDVAEPSVFVPNIPYNLAKKIQERFQQDAVVYSGPETNGKTVLIFNDGTQSDLGSFRPSVVSRAYSEIKGRPFVFEYIAQTHSEIMIEYILAKK